MLIDLPARSEGAVLFTVPLPLDAEPLKNLESARQYIAGLGAFSRLSSPDLDAAAGRAYEQLCQQAQAQHDAAQASQAKLQRERGMPR